MFYASKTNYYEEHILNARDNDKGKGSEVQGGSF